MTGNALKRLAVVAFTALVGVGVAAGPAQATDGDGHRGLSGRTTVTTAPGIAEALVQNGVLPIVTAPGTQGLRYDGGLTVTAAFPVTGGRVALNPPSGKVYHRGGITFVNGSRSSRSTCPRPPSRPAASGSPSPGSDSRSPRAPRPRSTPRSASRSWPAA